MHPGFQRTFGRNGGFALVDILITIMLIGIVAAMAIPVMAPLTTSMRLGQGAREVELELQNARMKAVATNRPMRVRFDCIPAGTYRMVELIGTTSAPVAADASVDRCKQSSYPYPPADRNPLTLPNNDGPTRTLPTGVSFGAVSTLEFWPDGSVHKQAAAENPWNVVAPTGTAITLTKGTNVRIITVNGLGKIQLQP